MFRDAFRIYYIYYINTSQIYKSNIVIDIIGVLRTRILIITGFGNIINKVFVIGINYSHYRNNIYLNSNSIF